MINTLYRLVAPKRFEVAFEDKVLKRGEVIVRPRYLSICHADQRYYQGLRSPEILKKKLPMALIHEGMGEVVYSRDDEIAVGQRVVMIPNQPVEEDEVIAENYRLSSRFCSSGYDGFLQEYLFMEGKRLIILPEEIPDEVAAFMELVSVGCHAIRRFKNIAHERRNRIAVWGDGNLGYIVTLLLKKMIPEAKVIVVGTNVEKLSNFTFADETYLTYALPEKFKIDHAFECVGGQYAEQAIQQIIDRIAPEGCISLLGVSELNVGINTRMVLEKGLRLFGSSRSGRADFVELVELLQKFPDVTEYLGSLVNQVITVQSMEDLIAAFEMDMKKQMGKIVMKWER